MIEYKSNYDAYSLFLATGKCIWSGHDTSGLISCLFRKTTKNKLRKSLWHTLLVYEKDMNKQLFFNFDIFRKHYISTKIESYKKIMEILQTIDIKKHSINCKDIVPYQKSFNDYTIDELLGILRDEYYYHFSSQFSREESMSSAKMKKFIELASIISDKSLRQCKKSSPDYSSGDLFDILFSSFYFERHLVNSPGSPILFMEIIGMIYDKWKEESM
jgi:hypothetical protein